MSGIVIDYYGDLPHALRLPVQKKRFLIYLLCSPLSMCVL